MSPKKEHTKQPINDPVGRSSLEWNRDKITENLRPPRSKNDRASMRLTKETLAKFEAFVEKHDLEGHASGGFDWERRGGDGALEQMFVLTYTCPDFVKRLKLVLDTVTIGKTTIEFISDIIELEDTTADAPFEASDQVKRVALPSLFHADMSTVTVWLQDFTTSAAVGAEILKHIAVLAAERKATPVTYSEGSLDGVTASTAARGHAPAALGNMLSSSIELQVFYGGPPGSSPFAVLTLGLEWKQGEENTQHERVATIIRVAKPTAPEQRWSDAPRWGASAFGGMDRGPGPGWKPMPNPSWGGFPRTGDVFGIRETMGMPPGYSQPFGSPYGHQHNAVQPEACTVSTTAIGRFLFLMQAVLDGVGISASRQFIASAISQVHSMFVNSVLAQRGQLVFEFQYAEGGTLMVTVRERANNRVHYNQVYQLV